MKKGGYEMKPLLILVVKFVSCMISFAIGLDLFFDATFADILAFSFFITFASYMVGERVVLPKLGKRAANITDFLLTYLSVWIFGSVLFDNYLQIAWGSIIAATLVTATEIVLHFILDKSNNNQTNEKRNPIFTKPLASFATEFGEERGMEDLKPKRK
jgi:hypothetical protein